MSTRSMEEGGNGPYAKRGNEARANRSRGGLSPTERRGARRGDPEDKTSEVFCDA